ncbi:MAG TPA: helix-turn-helix domain-containing protein [Phenylobacterium sp.]|nr:helix-turn-helix domain-containing protein [Phenylobacterium sp.]
MARAVGKRIRRSVEASKHAILEVAERHLIDDGPNGVKVQKIGRELGITDAAIHYHFGNREGLLEALLRFSGRRFVDDFAAMAESVDLASFSLDQAARLLTDLYGRRGGARLAMWLVLSGWSPKGSGMLLPMATLLNEARTRRALDRGLEVPTLEDSQRLIALLSALAFAQALTGDAVLRSVGLNNLAPDAFLSWVAAELESGRGAAAIDKIGPEDGS